MIPVDSFPATVQSAVEARPGPTVDGAPVRPGDVLVDADGDRRVVTRTGQGPTNDAVGLFDPDAGGPTTARGAGEHIDGDRWTVAWRTLGVATATADGDDSARRVVSMAGYDPAGDRYAWAWGAGPLAALAVPVTPVVSNGSAADLRAALAPPLEGAGGLASLLGTSRPALLDRLDRRVRSLSERRCRGGAGTTPSLTTTDVAIPTGAEPPVVESPDGAPLRPGDRLVYWEDHRPGDPLSADPPTLAAGHCLVVCRQDDTETGVTCYDLADGAARTLDPAELGARCERALAGGVVLRTLARDCFVDPIGTDRTYSVHAYAVAGTVDSAVLLAGSRRQTATPRLEHPLALSCQTYDRRDALRRGLAGEAPLDHPLSAWRSDHDSVAAMCERVARRVGETERFDTAGDGRI